MAPFTLWLLAAQAALAILGLSCLAGAFFAGRWNPPAWSYFRESAMFLVPAGVGLLVLGWMASYLPTLATLLGAIFAMCACAHNYVVTGQIDASRTLALMLAMFALWSALQHRRAVAPAKA
jgi:hypothetical protein